MKTKKNILILILVPFFYFGSCENEEQQSFLVENKFGQDLVLGYGRYHMDIPSCFNGMNRRKFLDDFVAKANSVKNFENIARSITSQPLDTLYIYIRLKMLII